MSSGEKIIGSDGEDEDERDGERGGEGERGGHGWDEEVDRQGDSGVGVSDLVLLRTKVDC